MPQLLDPIGNSERCWMSLEVNLVEVVGVEPTSKTCQMAALPQAWSALETSRRGTDEPLGTCAPLSRPLSGGVAAAYLVPPSGRPKPPFRRFNELGTQRSRGLARSLGCPRQREPVRSYRWQFDLGGLMRGPAVQPPPAPNTWITTCRSRSPPWCGVAVSGPRESSNRADPEYGGSSPDPQGTGATSPASAVR